MLGRGERDGKIMKAFLKKEWMEWLRTGRLLVLLLVFTLFGIMNPALAKLTPWMMEALSESLAETGIAATGITVDAMVSWAQFYKNFPMGLVIFVLLCSGSFTGEYQRGTLIPVVAKGLSRWSILGAKAIFLFGAWTVLYFLCFGITYGYNGYFWDNGVAKNLFFAGACSWVFGIWVVAALVFFSAFAGSSAQVLLGTGGVALGMYLLGLFPRFHSLLPAKLMEGMALLQGAEEPSGYFGGLAAAAIMAALCVAAGGGCFGKRKL